MGTRTRTVVAVGGGESPLFLRIARTLADDVRRGRLRAGEALPGTRALAASLGVNRNTVVAAYHELVAEGWVQSRVGGGTFVAESMPEAPRRSPAGAVRPATIGRLPAFAMTPQAPSPQPASFPRGTLVMAGGVPDVRLLPVHLLARAFRGALMDRGALDALRYGDARGDSRLRAAVADTVRERRGIPARPDDVLILRGSQMALSLAVRAIVPPGDAIAVETPGYPPAWAAFERAGVRVVAVAVDSLGLDVDDLAARVKRERIRAIYVTPHHQYPTTVTMAPGRRASLLDLARRERIAVLEDDYDHELHYEGRPVLPLASADVHGSVVYIGSLSKVLAPGLRLGYAVGPAAVLDRMARDRFVVDRQGDHIGERAAAELIEDGTVARHVRKIKRIYQDRRDRLVDLLTRALGQRIDVRVPSGGMALWVNVRLPPRKVVLWERRALEAGVAFVAGERLTFDGRPLPFARIGFAPLNDAEAAEAVKRLAATFPS